MNKVYWLSLLAVLALLTSCKSGEEATTKNPRKLKKLQAKELLEKVEDQQLNFAWLSTNAKVRYDDGENSQQFTARIRMSRDSILWVNITSILGVEVARIKMSSDSVQFLDRRGKCYLKKPFSFLEEYVPFSFDINLLQQIITGNYLVDGGGKMKSKNSKSAHWLTVDGEHLNAEFKLEPDDFLVTDVSLYEKASQREALVSITKHRDVEGRTFAQQREILFKGKDMKEVKIELKFSRVKFDQPLTFPFHVSSKYVKCS